MCLSLTVAYDLGKARILSTEWSALRGSTRVGSHLANKYLTGAKFTVGEKHTILQSEGNKSLTEHTPVTKKKSFITLKPGVNVIKLFYFVTDGEV